MSFEPGLLWTAVASGFLLGLATILSLGPQNLRLIEAGLTRSHAGLVATTGYLSEILVVGAGTGLLGSLAGDHPEAVAALRLAGVGFLGWCGLVALVSSVSPSGGFAGAGLRTRSEAIRSMLVVTWLNPLVYLEAMLLVGLLSTSFGRGMGAWFALGFLVASAIKFYGWAMVGRLLAPAFSRPNPRRVFSCASGALLLTAAILLAAQIPGGQADWAH